MMTPPEINSPVVRDHASHKGRPNTAPSVAADRKPLVDGLTSLRNAPRKVADLARVVTSILGVKQRIRQAQKDQRAGRPNSFPKKTQEFGRSLIDALGLKVVVHGSIPTEPALWVTNHISWTDFMVTSSLVPLVFLSKAEIKSWPIIGKIAADAGTKFIKRGSGDVNNVKDQLAEVLRQSTSTIFFPEATTSDGTHIKRLHGRLLNAALETGTPIQPAVIAYVDQNGKLDRTIPFINDMDFVSHLYRVLGYARQVTAHVLPLAPIDPTGKTEEQLKSELTQEMSQGLEQLHRKVIKENTRASHH